MSISKKKNNKPQVIDAMTIWNIRKPKYNGFVGGYGVHGKTSYSRKQKHKIDWRYE